MSGSCVLQKTVSVCLELSPAFGISTEPAESCRVKIGGDSSMGNIVQAPSIN